MGTEVFPTASLDCSGLASPKIIPATLSTCNFIPFPRRSRSKSKGYPPIIKHGLLENPSFMDDFFHPKIPFLGDFHGFPIATFGFPRGQLQFLHKMSIKMIQIIQDRPSLW